MKIARQIFKMLNDKDLLALRHEWRYNLSLTNEKNYRIFCEYVTKL